MRYLVEPKDRGLASNCQIALNDETAAKTQRSSFDGRN